MRRLLLASPLILAACAPVADIGGTAANIGSRAFVVQGKYDPLPCDQVLANLAVQKQKERDLTDVMNKSAQETSGQFVNAAVYWPTLAETRSHIRELEQTRAEKKCEAPKP